MRSFFLLLGVVLSLSSHAYSAATTQNPEIEHLIGFVATSDVRFIRNGKEYSSTEAADHLRDKLSKAGGRVKTAEDFIEGIASKSYLSGDPYLIKFRDGHSAQTRGWLTAELAKFREKQK